MSVEIIHCRLPPDTLRGLDGHIKALRKQGLPPRLTTRSSVVRALLAEQLGVDQSVSAAFEIGQQAQKMLQLTTSRALQLALAKLPDAIDAVAAETASATLQQIITDALRRVCADLPDANIITDAVLAEMPDKTTPARKR